MGRRALTLAMLLTAMPAGAADPKIFVATNPEREAGFASLAECEDSLGSTQHSGDVVRSGSVFNREHGNTTRCELVDGVPLVVVYPSAPAAESATTMSSQPNKVQGSRVPPVRSAELVSQ